jgi:CHAT domain
VVSQRDGAELVFQKGIAIDDASRDRALRTLAVAGAELFQRIFFGPAAAADVQQVGELLKRQATKPGSSLNFQVVATRFPVPWGILYFGDTSDGAVIDPELFLGMRHVVEQIPLQTGMLVDDTVIDSGNPSLAVSVNVNADIDGGKLNLDGVARQLAFWDKFATSAGAKITVAPRRTRAELLAALRDGARDQLLYLYCHAITNAAGDPGGIRNAAFLLTGNERVTLADLYRESPTAKPLPGNPLVFINACESAELRPEFYDGFIPYFMAKGARGVVGTECKTPAIFASEWALRFFPRFLDGEKLGDLFLELRREFHSKHGNPLGLLYNVYCDADTRIQPGLTI